MPSLNDVISVTHSLEGYVNASPSKTTNVVTAPAPSSDMEPGRNMMLRCPMPSLWSVSPDSLRQFYIKGQVPQSRVMLPAPAVAPTSDSVTTVQKVTVSSGAVSGGGASSSSTGTQASVVSIKTPVLPPGNKFIGSIALAKSFQLLSVAVQSPCRIQLYGTAMAQSLDLSRNLDEPPAAGTAQNIICDVALDTAPYNWSFQNRIGANADRPQTANIYVTVTNLEQNSDAETVVIGYVPLES